MNADSAAVGAGNGADAGGGRTDDGGCGGNATGTDAVLSDCVGELAVAAAAGAAGGDATNTGGTAAVTAFNATAAVTTAEPARERWPTESETLLRPSSLTYPCPNPSTSTAPPPLLPALRPLLLLPPLPPTVYDVEDSDVSTCNGKVRPSCSSAARTTASRSLAWPLTGTAARLGDGTAWLLRTGDDAAPLSGDAPAELGRELHALSGARDTAARPTTDLTPPMPALTCAASRVPRPVSPLLAPPMAVDAVVTDDAVVGAVEGPLRVEGDGCTPSPAATTAATTAAAMSTGGQRGRHAQRPRAHYGDDSCSERNALSVRL